MISPSFILTSVSFSFIVIYVSNSFVSLPADGAFNVSSGVPGFSDESRPIESCPLENPRAMGFISFFSPESSLDISTTEGSVFPPFLFTIFSEVFCLDLVRGFYLFSLFELV